MPIVDRTIKAFPRGRTTEELVVLMGAAFDKDKRQAVVAELQLLAQSGQIKLDRNGRWKSITPMQPQEIRPSAAGIASGFEPGADLLFAVPGLFGSEPLPDGADLGDEPSSGAVDPGALLRYWRSALRSDPRGAITQVPDRHGVQWVLVTGQGPVSPESDCRRILTFRLDSLPYDFRQALLRREANELTLAVGWPIMVGRKSGVPAIWPVGLLAAEWSRLDGTLRVMIDSDDVVVNPEWLDGAARTTGWRKPELSDIFASTDGLGLRTEEFLNRLREAAAKHLRGRVDGVQMASQIDLMAGGIYDIAALFLPTESTFTAGAVRDLDTIGSWPVDRLQRTALAPVLGLQPVEVDRPPPDVNVGMLNGEQIDAVRNACIAPLTVVTGPPGTGKSQAIISMAASVLLQGGTVLVASKNHQALDAVEDRLGSLSPDLPFMVRTLDPQREIDRSAEQVLSDLLRDTGVRPRPVDPELLARADSISAARSSSIRTIRQRAALECELAELVERIQSRTRFAVQDERPATVSEAPQGFLSRILHVITSLLRRSDAKPARSSMDALAEGAPLDILISRLATLRAERAALPPDGDPVRLTAELKDLMAKLLPIALSGRVALREDERQELESIFADHQFHGDRTFPPNLVRAVLQHRPLWLASVLGTPKRIPLDDGLFDLVIFDEASQCDIASALPLFARAKRAVVVGDDRQLSFIPQLGQAQDRNLMKAQGLPTAGMGRFAQSRQSLFDFAKRVPGVEPVLLRHQYRSAGPIVDYISETFYGGQLTTSHDPATIRPPQGQKPGIAWTHVPAPALAQQGNVNPAEAEAIATHIRMLLVDQDYGGSIGVIAPFRPQVQVIETAVKGRVPSQKLERAEFRVATVDGFQGQERDLILFSPCLSASSAFSAVTFLQKDLRRLNVAISRARAVAHVFGDLDYARSGKIGALARLAAVATEPRRQVGEGVFDSEWERRVFHALRDRGLDPKPQHEIAGRRLDFALFGRNGIKLDLEIDGRHWHQDTDGRRKMSDYWRDHQLQSLGWRVRRFWVDELSKDMEACLDLIERDLS
jgi:very-short-patch-repair endonuclease